MPDTLRRLLLRLAVKSLITLGVLAMLWILLAGVRCSPREAPPLPLLQYPVSASALNPLERIAWSGGNVLVVYRDAQQPADVTTSGDTPLPTPRTHQARWVVLYDRGGEMGCPLEWVPARHRQAPHQPWAGGFRDICQNNWFDSNGRSLSGNPARDIAVPPHHWQGENLLILGENSDNPAP